MTWAKPSPRFATPRIFSSKPESSKAGAQWIDQVVVTDEGPITSRSPNDLDAFIAKNVEEIEEGAHLGRRPQAA